MWRSHFANFAGDWPSDRKYPLQNGWGLFWRCFPRNQVEVCPDDADRKGGHFIDYFTRWQELPFKAIFLENTILPHGSAWGEAEAIVAKV
jgi:hypothetical protein